MSSVEPRTEAGRAFLETPYFDGGALFGSTREAFAAQIALIEAEAAAGSLDAAWADVEAALPDGWRLWSLTYDAYDEPRWRAIAGVQHDDGRAPFIGVADGPAPAEALLALAGRLRAARHRGNP